MQNFDKGPKRSSDEKISAEPKMGNGPMLSDEELVALLWKHCPDRTMENFLEAEVEQLALAKSLRDQPISEHVYRQFLSERQEMFSRADSHPFKEDILREIHGRDISWLAQLRGKEVLFLVEEMLVSASLHEQAFGAIALQHLDKSRAVREICRVFEDSMEGRLPRDFFEPMQLIFELNEIGTDEALNSIDSLHQKFASPQGES